MYIPNEWIKNRNNAELLFKILSDDTDVIMERDDKVGQLRRLGEDILADKLERGEISING